MVLKKSFLSGIEAEYFISLKTNKQLHIKYSGISEQLTNNKANLHNFQACGIANLALYQTVAHLSQNLFYITVTINLLQMICFKKQITIRLDVKSFQH